VLRHDPVNGILTAVLYVVLLSLAVRAGLGLVAERGTTRHRRIPIATIVATLIVGVPTVLQLTVAPSLLGTLERDPAPIASGQFWRLGTSLVVQDGGLAGSIFNLVALGVVGVVAERVWGSARWTVIALVSALAGELWGLVVQPVGAGNSVAVFGLAAAVSVVAVRHGTRMTRVTGALSLLVAAVLLAMGDIHGGAATAGALVGWAMITFG
jgi:membrane associated rhomboid family serine protease